MLKAASMIIEPLARYNETGALVPWLVDDCAHRGQRWR